MDKSRRMYNYQSRSNTSRKAVGGMKLNRTQTVAAELWLNYFNQYLFEKNIITESERNKMKNLIGRRVYATKSANE